MKLKARLLRLVVVAALVGASYFLSSKGYFGDSASQSGAEATQISGLPPAAINNDILQAIANKRSDVVVQAHAQVIKLLPTDNKGSRHQRFLVAITDPDSPRARDKTVLVAHNIDLAPEVTALQQGDTVLLKGEFEYNDKGGVLHWTHHDPRGRHEGGWIEHKGKRYE